MLNPIPRNLAETQIGGFFALAAFSIWSGFPIYFKAVAHVGALEVLAHRIVWTLAFVALIIFLLRRFGVLRKALASRSLIKMLCLSSAFISVNWLTFIWAIANNHVLDSSLGYFINPLVNVVLGVIFLGERLRPTQWISVILAFVGVLNLVVWFGQIPWIALTVAITFAFYGLIRKQVAVDPFVGLFIETLLVLPLALIYLLYLFQSGNHAFLTNGPYTDFLLLISGVLTALPLILFASAARRLKLSTLGLFQYTVPTGHFLLAVFAYGENFTFSHLITFACIWAALVLYGVDSYRSEKQYKPGADK